MCSIADSLKRSRVVLTVVLFIALISLMVTSQLELITEYSNQNSDFFTIAVPPML